MNHDFQRAPSLPTLRKLIVAAEKANVTKVTFQYGEQHSEFTKLNGRWHHNGNGMLKAGYKLADALEMEANSKREGGGWPLRF